MHIRPLAVFCAGLTLVGCATQSVSFRRAPSQPAAQRMAKISLDDRQNAVVRVEYEHLAPLGRLIPPRSFYVLWAENPEGKVDALGHLVVGKNLDGSFRGTTAMTRFRLVISAEDLATPARPSEPHVMTTEFVDATSKKWYQIR